VAVSYEHGTEISGSIIGLKFLDYLNNCQLLKEECSMELGRYVGK
jgi:hypothetical protein